MKHHIALTLALSVALIPAFAADQPDPRVQQSRAAIQEFAGMLKGELLSAMKAGGATQAISVCKDKAPEIAANISEQKGWEVGRTSLKTRNRGNAPDTWEQTVLERFEERKAAGEPVQSIDHAEEVEVDGQKQFRYMKAIPTQMVCLNCHGKDVDPAVLEKLDQIYPQDRARGFSAGDIRGAFTITQPM